MAYRERNGRYTHTWCFQGFDEHGVEWARCDNCGLWRNGGTRQRTKRGPAMTWSSPGPEYRNDAHLVTGTPATTRG